MRNALAAAWLGSIAVAGLLLNHGLCNQTGGPPYSGTLIASQPDPLSICQSSVAMKHSHCGNRGGVEACHKVLAPVHANAPACARLQVRSCNLLCGTPTCSPCLDCFCVCLWFFIEEVPRVLRKSRGEAVLLRLGKERVCAHEQLLSMKSTRCLTAGVQPAHGAAPYRSEACGAQLAMTGVPCAPRGASIPLQASWLHVCTGVFRVRTRAPWELSRADKRGETLPQHEARRRHWSRPTLTVRHGGLTDGRHGWNSLEYIGVSSDLVSAAAACLTLASSYMQAQHLSLLPALLWRALVCVCAAI